MIVKQIIPATTQYSMKVHSEKNTLRISEFFYNTIQGEGINIGVPAAFLRLQGCTLNCAWCDSKEVWRFGNTYSFEALFKIIDETDLVEKLMHRMHLVITGGSPLMQQYRIIDFIKAFITRYGFKPYIEIENECVLPIATQLKKLVNCWNHSPKLSNSAVGRKYRIKEKALEDANKVKNGWFKFVISDEEDWKEIVDDFILPGFIDMEKIILMPEAKDWEELVRNREKVVEIAIKNGVRYCTREHIALWNKTVGV